MSALSTCAKFHTCRFSLDAVSALQTRRPSRVPVVILAVLRSRASLPSALATILRRFSLRLVAKSIRFSPQAFVLAFVALMVCYRRGYLLLYGDAVAHLAIARRIVDSHYPGLAQLGGVWLPFAAPVDASADPQHDHVADGTGGSSHVDA